MKKDLNGLLVQIVEELAHRGVTLAQARREFEKQFILASLEVHDGNLSRSAKSLGVHRNTLRNKVGNLGIEDGGESARRPAPRLRRH
jgi:DNA-binding NtrC family response regulator